MKILEDFPLHFTGQNSAGAAFSSFSLCREVGKENEVDENAEAVQKFFLEEIQLGEGLLAQGEYEKRVDHQTNATAVCGQPQQSLQALQQTLPPPVFQMLLTKLSTVSQRIYTIVLITI
eukprot:bmy_22352T0